VNLATAGAEVQIAGVLKILFAKLTSRGPHALCIVGHAFSAVQGELVMPFELSPLPYEMTALEPHMSAETLEIHRGRHHKSYVDALNKLVEGKPPAGQDLETRLETLIASSEGALFNNAAQVWNHDFFWKCIKPRGGGRPSGRLAEMINEAFGSFDRFASEFSEAAGSQFGSGWAWLVLNKERLAIRTTANADLPSRHGERALLTIDVWEHAYYIDHRNLRPRYVDGFLKNLVNWDFALGNLNRAFEAAGPRLPG
jgi:Fe-Mn family superoxide dismutase